MYKEDLALNNLQWLIYHKTQSKQTIFSVVFLFLISSGIVVQAIRSGVNVTLFYIPKVEWLIFAGKQLSSKCRLLKKHPPVMTCKSVM